jgi:hypothetical protein
MINWKPEGRKKRGRPRRTWKDRIYTAMSERGLRMEQSKAMEYGRWKASPEVLKPRNVFEDLTRMFIVLSCMMFISAQLI